MTMRDARRRRLLMSNNFGGVSSKLIARYIAGEAVPGGASFSRASTADYQDNAAAWQVAGVNVLRDAHYISGVRTVLLEQSRTNSFLNSGAPASHTSPSLATGTYVMWLTGTGSVAVAAGTAVGSGFGTATAASPLVFSITTGGTVTFTVTGSVTLAQCENGGFATSYIPTGGAAVTRAVDSYSVPFTTPPQAMTLYTKFVERGTSLVTSSSPLFIGGVSSVANPRFYSDVSAGRYRAVAVDASGTVASVAAAVSPSLGDTVELRIVRNQDGTVSLGQTINGSAEAVVTSGSAVAFDGAYISLYLNARVTTAPGVTAFLGPYKVALGVQTLDAMRGMI